MRKTWRALVPPTFRKYGQGVALSLAQRRVDVALGRGEPTPRQGPLIVSGLINDSKGVSRAARLTLKGVQAAGFAPVAHDLAPLFSAADDKVPNLPIADPGGVWLMHVNAPEAIAAMSRVDPREWLGRFRIGYWAYELPRVPQLWVNASRSFHEIWAPSTFVAEALRHSGVTTPIRVMPHPALLDDVLHSHVPSDDNFIVLAMGDLKSSAARKNLVGAIEIYRRAFPSVARSTRLILKIQSGDAHPKIRDAISTAALGRGDIEICAKKLSDEGVGRLIAGSSVLLSPHRSEGFGLVLAEAFLAGVPALATGWSGNMDFMSGVSELLIASTLVPVRDPMRIYTSAGCEWAEPSIDDAAIKLRRLAASPDLRRKLAARGREALRGQLQAWSREALVEAALGRLVSA